jgi:hypothetical protein
MRPTLCLILSLVVASLVVAAVDGELRRKPRVFVSESNSWEQSASVHADAQGAGWCAPGDSNARPTDS